MDYGCYSANTSLVFQGNKWTYKKWRSLQLCSFIANETWIWPTSGIIQWKRVNLLLILLKEGNCAAWALNGNSRIWLNSRYFKRQTLQRQSGRLICTIHVNQKDSTWFCSLQVFSLTLVNWRVRKRQPFTTKARESSELPNGISKSNHPGL